MTHADTVMVPLVALGQPGTATKSLPTPLPRKFSALPTLPATHWPPSARALTTKPLLPKPEESAAFVPLVSSNFQYPARALVTLVRSVTVTWATALVTVNNALDATKV